MIGTYKKEDLKFLNMKTRNQHINNFNPKDTVYKVYEIEDQLSLEEKINFIDELKNGIATYMLDIINKWEKEKDSLPKDIYGNVKTISKKAWINRNDKRNIMSKYDLGNYPICGNSFKCLSIECPTSEYGYNNLYTGKHIVNQWFHDLCNELYEDEKKYFKSIDPLQVKLSKVEEYGNKYGILNNQMINDVVYNRKEDVTEEQLDICIAAYKKIESVVNEVTQEVNERLDNINKYKNLISDLKNIKVTGTEYGGEQKICKEIEKVCENNDVEADCFDFDFIRIYKKGYQETQNWDTEYIGSLEIGFELIGKNEDDEEIYNYTVGTIMF